MRRVMVAMVAVVAVAVATTGCKKDKQPAQYVEDAEAPQIASAVNVADPRTAIQLLRGFYGVESNAWRWTASKFAVALRPPKAIPAGGAKLYMDYSVPEVFLQKIPRTTLTVTVNGKALDPETLSKSGSFRLERTVPAAMLQGDTATVEFSLDKFLEAGAVDQRELGLIVTVIGLQGAQPAAPAAPSAK